MADTLALESNTRIGSRQKAAANAAVLATVLGGVLSGGMIAQAKAQALPVAGFAPTDIEAILGAWPFDGPEFSATSLGGGDGAAEALLKELITAIRSDPRFVPVLRPGDIAQDAVLRPPPDSILWPSDAQADAAEVPPPLGDPGAWILDNRLQAGLHRSNALMLAAVGPAALEQAGVGYSFVSPALSPAIANDSQTLAFSSARGLVTAMEALASGCVPGPDCTAINRALVWAGRDFGPAETPIQVKIGQALIDAASVGGFAETPAQRLAMMTARAGQRRQLKVTLAAAAGGTQTPGLYRIEPVEALPWEIATVLGAAVLEMRKLERAGPVWPVTFDGTAAQALKEDDFRYKNFDLSAVAVTRYQRAFSGAMDLSAILTFVDGGGRRGIASAVLSFLISGDGIQVQSADLVLMAAPETRVRLVIAPAGLSASANFSGMLNAAVEHEVTPKTAGSFLQNFEISAFFLDRLPPDGQVQIRLAADQGGPVGFGVGGASDFDGWRVARMDGAFALNGPSEFFIKAVVQPGGPVPGFDRGPEVAGEVSSLGAKREFLTTGPTPPNEDKTFPNLAAGE